MFKHWHKHRERVRRFKAQQLRNARKNYESITWWWHRWYN